MIKDPDILGPIGFFGFENNIIFIQHDEEDNGLHLISQALDGVVVVLTPHPNTVEQYLSKYYYEEVLIKQSVNVCDLYKIIKFLSKGDDRSPVNYYVIDGVDNFNVSNGKRLRGSVIKSYLSMCASSRLLKGANIIITSSHNEYGIEEIADKVIKLTKQCR